MKPFRNDTLISCPCGSGKSFSDCCAQVLQDRSRAETAEQLMRSRYTAFTRGNRAHIQATWAEETRPDQVNADDDSIQWLGLEIEECEQGTKGDSTGTVLFTASYLESGKFCRLREVSEFVKRDNCWYYLVRSPPLCMADV